MSNRVFVAADFSQLESWLTAYFAKDEVMQAELENGLRGGHKIHAINAAAIYGCAPEDAKKTIISLQGKEATAYDGGKRSAHAFNYGMGASHMAKTFWIPLAEAQRIIGVLSAKYVKTVQYRQDVCDEVFGIQRYMCARCGYVQDRDGGTCPQCAPRESVFGKKRSVPVALHWKETVQEPARQLFTPFGRRRIYLGRRADGANAVASQRPQSCGASVWYRTLLRLNGYDPYTQGAWSHPGGSAIWSPRLSAYGKLYAPFETFVATGTYDSFLLETTASQAETVLEWLVWTMEQSWPELGGLRFPAEGSIGLNWGDYDEEKNPNGLKDIPRKAFTAACPYDYECQWVTNPSSV